MLNQDDFAVYEVLVYLLKIREAGDALYAPTLDSLSSLATGIEHTVVEFEVAEPFGT